MVTSARWSAFFALLVAVFVFALPAWALKNLGPGDRISDVSVVTPEGRTVALSQRLPATGGLVVFWASWNPRSQETLSYLAELHSRYSPHGLVVLPVNVEHEGTTLEDRQTYASTYGTWGLPWPTYFDPALDAFDAVGVISLPTSLYLTRDLIIVGGYPGFPGEARDALPLLIEKGLGIWKPAVEVRKPTEIRHEPSNGAGAVFQMGRLMVGRGQRRKATAYFTKAANLDPGYPEAFTALLYLAHLAGDEQRVAAGLGQLKEKGAGDVRFLEAYGLSLLVTGQQEAARTVLAPLVDAEEPHPKGLLSLSLVHALEGDVSSAEKILQRLQAWPVGGIPMAIDVSAYVDPDASPEQRWSDPRAVLLRLLELN
ncbi:MAG: redoxin domain-containing protein [Deferrisomatales bacterium]|nr:redoxin domain-containing protein [Deferrisomatales bacterium]